MSNIGVRKGLDTYHAFGRLVVYGLYQARLEFELSVNIVDD